MLGGLASGNTLSTANLDVPGNNNNSTQNSQQSQSKYDEQNVLDLAYDLGVDKKLLKSQLQTLLTHKF